MGTDAVLLGCWAKFKSPKTILDIGSGTGVIGLIAAQRYPMASLYGIDPLKVHVQCTEINYKQCAFLKSYCVVKETLQQFSQKPEHLGFFDAIVCNPPYFKDSLKSNVALKNIARHQETLNTVELLESIQKLLTAEGSAAIIIPYTQKEETITNASAINLFLKHSCSVYASTESKKPIRIMLQFNKTLCESIPEEQIVIEGKQHRIYTAEYKTLTQDFYINF